MKKRGTKSASGSEGSEPGRVTSRDEIVEQLVNAKLDPEKSKLFADRVRVAARRFKHPKLKPHELRAALLAMADKFDVALRALDNASDAWSHLNAYGMRRAHSELERESKQLVRLGYPPWRMPNVNVLRLSLVEYADVARQLLEAFPKPARGRQPDAERFRPVWLVAGEWIDVFGTKPGAGHSSPFVRACHVVLPLFGIAVPTKLHEHVASALSQVREIVEKKINQKKS